jgi:TolA-binding protein
MSNSFSGRLLRATGQLALALINATLILFVVALFLALKLANTVERVTETAIAAATQQVEQLSPIADRAERIEDQIEELKADVVSIRLSEDTQVARTAETLMLRLEDLDASLSEMNALLAPAVETVTTEPGMLVERAVQISLAEAGTWVTTLSGCKAKPESF